MVRERFGQTTLPQIAVLDELLDRLHRDSSVCSDLLDVALIVEVMLLLAGSRYDVRRFNHVRGLL